VNGLIEFVKTLGPARIAAMGAATAILIGRPMKLAEARGYAGQLVLLPEPGLGAEDCRNGWADGGIRRERGAIEARINEAVARYLGSNRKSLSFSDSETVQ